MIIADAFNTMLNNPVRALKARVELTNGSTLEKVCTCHDHLQNFTIERVGEESKFFGFGICQKLNVTFVDKNRELNITKDHNLDVTFGVGTDYIYPFPYFKPQNISRDENTNALTVTAYDALYQATAHTVAELVLPTDYTIKQFALACAALLGLPMKILNVNDAVFDTLYTGGANFEGTENIRDALNAVAEATQTIYYISGDWELTFKRLDISGDAVYTIDRNSYISLDSRENRRLGVITHATELGDNVSAKTAASGTTQYVRDNPFWELREDIATILENAIATIGGLSINQFECDWRGNYLLEIGDKISLITKDNKAVSSYILDDTISFNGALSENTQWHYTESDSETASNPTSLGEVLKQTYARVDKANKQIDIVASESAENKDAISALQINTESISASVTDIETRTTEAIEGLSESIETLTTQVKATITAEDVQIAIENELSNGVGKVKTSTGFTFDDTGLTVEKSNSEIKTQITEDGMQVFKKDEVVLTANNEGVNATNLHATTYLIIGANSCLEDYGSRTGCFWIGG